LRVLWRPCSVNFHRDLGTPDAPQKRFSLRFAHMAAKYLGGTNRYIP
jgi:hypothetical protein